MRSEFYPYTDFETGLEFIATGRIDESGEPKTTASTTLLDQMTNAFFCRNAAKFFQACTDAYMEGYDTFDEDLLRATELGVRRTRELASEVALPDSLGMVDIDYVYLYINTLLARAAELEGLAEQNQAMLTAGH